MLIFLHGPDDYRRNRKKLAILEEFRKRHSGSWVGVFDLEEPENREGLRNFLAGQSIFDDAKLAVLENLSEVGPAAARELVEPIADSARVTVLISENSLPMRQFGFLARHPAAAQSFELLSGRQWEEFVEKEAETRSIRLEAGALSFLSRVYAGDSWGLVTELEKLRWFGDRAVGARELQAAGLEIPPNVWTLLSLIRDASAGQRLAALEQVLARGEPPAKLFNILASSWTERTAAFASHDRAVKSGKLEYEETLLDLVLS
ncbi:hypothetical protein C4587_01360 [Candidatus Parcubacteria bacterium]|nr:MAG: hypothetical protein C4587_01360 [Candidatus Parcubacteria bacterium]